MAKTRKPHFKPIGTTSEWFARYMEFQEGVAEFTYLDDSSVPGEAHYAKAVGKASLYRLESCIMAVLDCPTGNIVLIRSDAELVPNTTGWAGAVTFTLDENRRVTIRRRPHDADRWEKALVATSYGTRQQKARPGYAATPAS